MSITITNNYNNIPIVYTGNTKDSILQTESDGTVRFDRELAKAACSGQPSFGNAITREEFLQSLDAKLEEIMSLPVIQGTTDECNVCRLCVDRWNENIPSNGSCCKGSIER